MKNLDRKTIPIVLYSKSAYIARQNSRFYRAKQALLQNKGVGIDYQIVRRQQPKEYL